MSINNDTRHCRVQTRSKLPATIEEFNEALGAVLRDATANDRVPAKALAQLTDRSHRATEKWLAAEHAPHPFHLLVGVARNNETVRRWIAHLIGLEADVVDHHEWQQEMAKFARLTAEIAARNGGGK